MLDAVGAPIGVQQQLMRHAQVSPTMNTDGNAYIEGKREANGKVVRMVLAGRKEKATALTGPRSSASQGATLRGDVGLESCKDLQGLGLN